MKHHLALKRSDTDTCYNMDAPWKHKVKLAKHKEYTSDDPIYMKCLDKQIHGNRKHIKWLPKARGAAREEEEEEETG